MITDMTELDHQRLCPYASDHKVIILCIACNINGHVITCKHIELSSYSTLFANILILLELSLVHAPYNLCNLLWI